MFVVVRLVALVDDDDRRQVGHRRPHRGATADDHARAARAWPQARVVSAALRSDPSLTTSRPRRAPWPPPRWRPGATPPSPTMSLPARATGAPHPPRGRGPPGRSAPRRRPSRRAPAPTAADTRPCPAPTLHPRAPRSPVWPREGRSRADRPSAAPPSGTTRQRRRGDHRTPRRPAAATGQSARRPVGRQHRVEHPTVDATTVEGDADHRADGQRARELGGHEIVEGAPDRREIRLDATDLLSDGRRAPEESGRSVAERQRGLRPALWPRPRARRPRRCAPR